MFAPLTPSVSFNICLDPPGSVSETCLEACFGDYFFQGLPSISERISLDPGRSQGPGPTNGLIEPRDFVFTPVPLNQ